MLAPPVAVRATRYWITRYRKVWRGTMITLLAQPILFFAAFGLGVGRLVDRNEPALPGGLDYAEFLAPGLLAGTVMLTAFFEAAWPVLGALKWHRSYYAQQASPLTEGDIALGHQLFMGLRAMLVASIFTAVMLAFGVVGSPLIILAILLAPIVGWAFSMPMAAFSIGRKSDYVFPAVSRFLVQPLFLLSGTFFPLSQLPAPIQPIARISPVWHAAELYRALNWGATEWSDLGHLAYLVAVVAGSCFLTVREYRKRLRA